MSQQSITFTKIAELYIQELRTGTVPQLDEYQRAFPHLADEIQRNFPLLQMMERAGQPIELKPGDTLGGCIIESEIGRGGMGIVYRARDVVSNRNVALKVLPIRANDGGNTKRFEHEREAMSRLNHPNIVPVYSHGCTEHFAYLVIKLIDGFNLAQILSNEAGYRSILVLAEWRNNWLAFAEMAAELASGLQHAHEKGLVHRDIKPANLLLDGDGKIWISDFGLAKLWDTPLSVSITGNVIGTPRYMAPEQSQGICDARSDVFSLGVTLYEMASGEHANQGETFGEILRNRNVSIRDIRKVAPGIPAELAGVIMRACQHDPDKRYQTAYEMQYVLQRYCQGFSKADRRKFNRPSDDQYRERTLKNIRRALLVCGCITLLIIASPFLTRWSKKAINSGKSYAIQELESPTQELIDKLGHGDQDDVVDVVSEVLNASIKKHSTTQWNYSEKAKQDLLDRAATIKQMFVKHQLEPANMNHFMSLYRTSSLAVAGRLLHLIPQIDRNIADHRHRDLAYEAIKQYSSAIINRAVEKAEANQFIDNLVRGRFNSIDESSAVRIPPEELFPWLNALQAKLATLPPEKLQSHINVPIELDQMMHESFMVPAARPR